MSELILQFGQLLKFCICRYNVVLLEGSHNIEKHSRHLENLTLDYLMDILNSLGFQMKSSDEFVAECCRVLDIMLNYKMPMDDFKELMENIENYQQTQQRKKIEKLCSECLKTKVVFDVETISECSREIDNFICTFRESPKMYLPIFRHFPWYLLQRKRVYKSILKVENKLCEMLNQQVKLQRPEEDRGFQIFLLLYILISLSTKCSSKKSKPSTNLETNPDAIVHSQEQSCFNNFDICGIKIYKTGDYIKICDFDIPNQTFIIVYDKLEN